MWLNLNIKPVFFLTEYRSYGASVKRYPQIRIIYPKKFGRLENNAYFCSIKYQESEDKYLNRYINISLLNNKYFDYGRLLRIFYA